MTDLKIVKCQNYNNEFCNNVIKMLNHYNADIFMRELKNKYRLNQLPSADNLSISLKNIPCSDLMEFVDELKMYGKQHIFLFSLENNNNDYLNSLSDPQYIRERLRYYNLEDRFNNNICIWKAQSPYLASVKYIPDENNRKWLYFKWIETRGYRKQIKNTLKLMKERSANFFLINLEDGSAQLRLQCLQSRPQKKLIIEYNNYMKEISKLIEFHRFSTVLLQPIMRNILYNSILPITDWRVKSKIENLQGNRANPDIIKRLRLPLINFIPKEISVYWECLQEVHGRKRLYFTMNGLNNSITFNSVTDKLKVDFILEKLQKVKNEKLEFEKIKMNELSFFSTLVTRLHHLSYCFLVQIFQKSPKCGATGYDDIS